MSRSRLWLVVAVLLAPGCALQPQAHQPVQSPATLEEFLGSIETPLIDAVGLYRVDAANAEVRGQNGDAIRRLCEADAMAGFERWKSDHRTLPPNWVHKLWGVRVSEIIDEIEEVYLKVAQQCWW